MFHLQRVVVALIALVLVHPIPGFAQSVCEDPANLTFNCGFNFGISFWVLWSGDAFIYVDDDGHYADGSIEVASASTMGFSTSIAQCIDGVGTLPRVNAGFWVQLLAGPVESCSLMLTQYASSGCSGYVTHGWAARDSFTPGWDWVGGGFAIEPGIASVDVWARCFSMAGDFTVRFDDIYLGPSLGPEVFRDGFEGSDTAQWSQTVGGPLPISARSVHLSLW